MMTICNIKIFPDVTVLVALYGIMEGGVCSACNYFKQEVGKMMKEISFFTLFFRTSKCREILLCTPKIQLKLHQDDRYQEFKKIKN